MRVEVLVLFLLSILNPINNNPKNNPQKKRKTSIIPHIALEEIPVNNIII